MGAQPKRKISKARQGKRRSHLGMEPAAFSLCPQCHSPKLPHHACPTCGSYAGREVIKIESAKRKAA